MYKEIIFGDVKFQTTRGLLTPQQVVTLPVTELDVLAVSLEEAYNNSKGKSFLSKRSVKDKTVKLQFDFVLDVLNTKLAQEEEALNAKEIKEHNQKILAKIAANEEKELDGMSSAELKKLLK